MLEQSVAVAVVAILADFHGQCRAVEGNVSASRIDEMGDGSVRPHVVVDDDPAGIDARADAVVEDDGDTVLEQPLEMVVLGRILGL